MAKRLTKELADLLKEQGKNPSVQPRITASFNRDNMREIHYVIEGTIGTPYEGGVYHGKLLYPDDYPFNPPSIIMLTPSGRFEINKRLCLSISDYLPESWNPGWCLSAIVVGLYSFMLDPCETLGSIETSIETKKQLAQTSLEYNVKNTNDSTFCELFPTYVERYFEQEEKRKRKVHH